MIKSILATHFFYKYAAIETPYYILPMVHNIYFVFMLLLWWMVQLSRNRENISITWKISIIPWGCTSICQGTVSHERIKRGGKFSTISFIAEGWRGVDNPLLHAPDTQINDPAWPATQIENAFRKSYLSVDPGWT